MAYPEVIDPRWNGRGRTRDFGWFAENCLAARSSFASAARSSGLARAIRPGRDHTIFATRPGNGRVQARPPRQDDLGRSGRVTGETGIERRRLQAGLSFTSGYREWMFRLPGDPALLPARLRRRVRPGASANPAWKPHVNLPRRWPAPESGEISCRGHRRPPLHVPRTAHDPMATVKVMLMT